MRTMPPPPPPRRVGNSNGRANGHIGTVVKANNDSDDYIDWANLPEKDKEVLFAWLDEFFAAYFERLKQSKSKEKQEENEPAPPPIPARKATQPATVTAPVNGRPPLPGRKSTTEAAPTTKHSIVIPAPSLPARRPDLSLQRRAESEPTPETNAPPKPPPRRTLPPPPKPHTRATPEPAPVQAAPRINLSTKPTSSTPAIPSNKPAISHDSYEAEPEYGQVDECLRCRDYTAVDQYATYFPRENVESIHQLAWDLTSPFEHQFDKLRAIMFWLHLNIAYDAYSFLNHCVKPSTPDSTLKSGMAVCEGYAGLFSALALAIGLESITIGGHGKGFGYAPLAPGQPLPPYSAGHAWNAVKLEDGSWKLIDSCWAGGALDGSGVFQRRWDGFHFSASNEEFGERHFPDPKESWKQFVEPLKTWEEYISAVDTLPTLTGGFGSGEYARHLIWPNTKYLKKGRETFYIKKKCEHFREKEEEEYVHVVMGPLDAQERGPGKAGWKAMTLDAVNGGWRYDGLFVASGEKPKIATVKVVDGADARGLGKAEYDRLLGKKAMQFEVLCQWEVE
ncbi:hypothetical protein BDY19DRAFT_974765 [Irpex rosettiformis]|uniref:Uncharacterized protein n=1 Tax=Irpex rosettiformis TaxID=378272 RepID=A0ACB8TQ52_9APHY|nr:hypothetical protein BDY19DRAFT_974765 [Irpex rosettiformis]